MQKLLTIALALLTAVPAVSLANPVLRLENIYDTAPYPEAHASTIVQTTKGTIAAA